MNKICFDKNTGIFCDEEDFEGVRIVSGWVKKDLRCVFGEPDADSGNGVKIIAGTAGKSRTLQKMYEDGTISKDGLMDGSGLPKWEVYKIDAICQNGETVIVIQGSDKRGTMYGLLSVSEACGVSPLVNWSGAVPARKDRVELPEAFFGISKEPSVKYRGIFINDEWPAFGNWAKKRFGGINAKCYAEIFELLIRLRANYMWPAMWWSNFSLDGPGLESAELADKLGIVMSTSHHEPCMRTGEEYGMVRGPESIYGDAWDFLSNREGIIKFWEDGLKRNAPFENVITMGMRGERDTAIMAEASMADNIALLRDIIKTQNDLIRKYINPDLSKVPRQFVLFTEVEKFYYGDEDTPGLKDDPEMDGITVMFSDNNYGYMRTLPSPDKRNRNGGNGMYYHVDMHGGAYSYEWIGSTYLPRIWDQLGTAYDYGVDTIWVTNVGDLVSQELEVSYIMKLAFDMDAFGSSHPNETEKFIHAWVERIFGGYYSKEDLSLICEVIDRYSLINERRKHEIMNEHVYHPVHFGEARELYDSCKVIMKLCEELLERTPAEIYTAFYELIYYPAYGTANLHRTWIVSEWNKFYANQNRNTANDFCVEIDEGVKADQKLIDDFHALADGKFYGHALSEHFGFRTWNDSSNQLPMRTYIYPARKDRMLVSKSDEAWFYDGREYMKREDTVRDFLRPDVGEFVLEISCGSEKTLSYKTESDVSWLGFARNGEEEPDFKNRVLNGKTDKTDYIRVCIDRDALPEDVVSSGTVVVSDGGECFVTLTVKACGRKYYEQLCSRENGEKIPEGAVLVCGENAVAESSLYTDITSSDEVRYEVLSPYGRHGSGLKLYPNTADLADEEPLKVPYAEYVFVSDKEGEFEAEFIFAPSLSVKGGGAQYFDVRVNGEAPVRVNTILQTSGIVVWSPQWHEDNKRNAKIISQKILLKRGINRIVYSQISPNLILERIVLWDMSMPKKESYLGPKDSYRF